MESWYVKEGMKDKHDKAMRNWLKWVNNHRELQWFNGLCSFKMYIINRVRILVIR